MSEGPNCFQLSNIGDLTYSDYLKKIIERLESANASISVKDLLTILKQELTKFKEKNKSSLSEVFKFKPKIMMNLLLNFESFDQTTKTKDVYMPDERVINFNVGYLKLNFKGKLRLTADRDRNRMALGEKIPDGPKDSYGIIEDRDLIIKFDKPVIIKHFFIRPHRGVHEETDIYIGPPAKIVGYRYDIEIVTSNLNIANYQWYKVNFSNSSIVDAIKLPKGYDIDDIYISHDSDFAEPSDDETPGDHKLTSILQEVIDQILEQNNNKQNNDDDI